MSRRPSPTRQRILAEFFKGEPLTKYDLELRVHVDHRTVSYHLAELRATWQIHICGHRSDTSGCPTTIWKIGFAKDAVHKPKTNKRKCKDWRRKDDNAERDAAKRRAARARKKAVKAWPAIASRSIIATTLGIAA